jgi:anti-sigma regulatory factor (Ser/Thr protein kinase)
MPTATFEPLVGEIGAARAFASSAAMALGFPSDDVALVVSELATNACVHAHSPFTVSVSLTGSRLTVEVADCDPRTPVKGEPSPVALSGRGLLIVDTLTSMWGIRDMPPAGKAVWAEWKRAPEPVPTPTLEPAFSN